jgi:hypothetical protein
VTVWAALVAVVAGAGALAGAERALLRRLAGDRRRLDVQRRARRAGLWLLAAGHVALAHGAVVLAAIAGAGALTPGGDGPGPVVVVAVVAVVLGAAGVVAALTRPALGVLAPGLVTAAAQEVVFRGAALGLLREAGADPVTAVGVVALAFAATRLPRGGRAAAAALLAGAVLGAVALALGSVVAAAALHAAVLVVVAGLGDRAARLAAAAATAGVGCGGHDPSSPACQACPLAPAAAGART